MQHGAEVKVAIDVDALGDQIAEMSAHIDAAMHIEMDRRTDRLRTLHRLFGVMRARYSRCRLSAGSPAFLNLADKLIRIANIKRTGIIQGFELCHRQLQIYRRDIIVELRHIARAKDHTRHGWLR
jgi:hypothetical protein